MEDTATEIAKEQFAKVKAEWEESRKRKFKELIRETLNEELPVTYLKEQKRKRVREETGAVMQPGTPSETASETKNEELAPLIHQMGATQCSSNDEDDAKRKKTTIR